MTVYLRTDVEKLSEGTIVVLYPSKLCRRTQPVRAQLRNGVLLCENSSMYALGEVLTYNDGFTIYEPEHLRNK